ncbi:hypothetical protein P344_03100 [Spiroplasma mirum ATCC 29335]|uniref:Exodeoxyribonuclease 7 large subunit n=1 Tax=Spiroplasma mirum ATCC 29335 TaxID=838561 RepID=W0GQP5_9MOLU|nr:MULTISPECIES: exodeoxyribonuclease VII large subunit [Spiroplasma]AHF60954.1 putative exodeoxyribonuclease VII large subunit [Spiroplasma mirum ATCC 29335]AHI57964.1 hypothetical protein P344_03100 [Spiroplasma mirum ATCC 29335]AKM53058.1 exodeoxyribonuclease VII large subunit [Spiroplasma atrichopogonis]
MTSNIFKVSEINAYIKNIIEQDHNLVNISVQGEISNITNHFSGHIYFTIKDEKSQLRAIMFSFNAKNLKFKLKEGLKIIAVGTVKLYEPQGTYSLQVVNISLDGIGDLFLQYEQLKQTLEQKGWFAQAIKKPIPKFPRNIGVITAPSGAAIRDIITTIHRRFPQTNIYLFPCLVQGKEAKYDIKAKIEVAQNFTVPLDTLIVGRGGGSIEDLWVFNEFEVAQAIYQCPIPIISSVGHEIDFTIADFVADLRAPTPTAAAELATPDQKELLIYLHQQYKTLITLIKNKVDNYQVTLNNLKNNYWLTTPQALYEKRFHNYQVLRHKFNQIADNFINHNLNQVSYYYQKLLTIIQNYLLTLTHHKNNLIAKLDLLSPLKTLTRGYSVTYDSKQKILLLTSQVQNNDKIITRLSDGLVYSQVTDIKEEGK